MADRALEALVTVDPVRAAPLLARDLESRPRAFAAACGGPVGSLPTLPYDPELLAAVRRRLGAMEPGSMALPRLAALLTAWGPDAGPAVPELLAQLPAYPRQLPKVLAAVCLPEQRAEVAEALRFLARTAPADDRMEAVRVLHQLTGDHGPLLSLLAERLAAGAGGGDSALRETATAAAALGPAAAPLVPALRAALNAPDADRNNPQMDADIALAVALHRITADAAEAVPVLAGVLGDDDGLWRRWTFVRAAEAAAGLGPAGRPLVPVLKALLADPEQVPSAVLALRAVAPTRWTPTGRPGSCWTRRRRAPPRRGRGGAGGARRGHALRRAPGPADGAGGAGPESRAVRAERHDRGRRRPAARPDPYGGGRRGSYGGGQPGMIRRTSSGVHSTYSISAPSAWRA